MRSIEEQARIVQILTGIVRNTPEETFNWLQQVDRRISVLLALEREHQEERLLNTLSGNVRKTDQVTKTFGQDDNIRVMQGMILTYQQSGAPAHVIEEAQNRLEDLLKGKQ